MIVSKERLAKYGLTQAQFDRLYELHRGLCGCCAERLDADPEGVAIDHDHDTTRVRGLLCRNCNTLLGRLGDNLERAEERFEQFKRYLGKRQKASQFAMILTSAIEETPRLLTEALHAGKTWMARCALLLGFELTSSGLPIQHREESLGMYGIGCVLGEQLYNAQFLGKVAENLHDGKSLFTGMTPSRSLAVLTYLTPRKVA